MYHPQGARMLGGERKAASAVSRLRPIRVVRSTGTARCNYRVNNMCVVSRNSALVTINSQPTKPMQTGANEEVPWQFTAWLESGIVSEAFRAPGGTELRRLQNQHEVVVAYGGRPDSSQHSLTSILASTSQWMADIAFERSAMALSRHILAEVNAVNEQPGLAMEKLHSSLQELSYDVMHSLGCATAWATPVYRPLPAAEAGLVPGTTGKITLEQCLELECHTPAVCHHHCDGSWDGNCTVYLPKYQLMPVTELGRAVDRVRLTQYLSNCSSSKSLSELLLLQFHKGLLAVGTETMLRLQHGKQQQPQLAHTAAAATAAVVGDNASGSTISCASGGGSGYRGYLTALGADGDDRMACDLTLVPAGLNRQQRHRQARLVSPRVSGSSAISSSSNSSGSSKPSGKQGVLRHFGSAFKRLCCKALRA